VSDFDEMYLPPCRRDPDQTENRIKKSVCSSPARFALDEKVTSAM
jgi:hypothetical protein